MENRREVKQAGTRLDRAPWLLKPLRREKKKAFTMVHQNSSRLLQSKEVKFLPKIFFTMVYDMLKPDLIRAVVFTMISEV